MSRLAYVLLAWHVSFYSLLMSVIFDWPTILNHFTWLTLTLCFNTSSPFFSEVFTMAEDDHINLTYSDAEEDKQYPRSYDEDDDESHDEDDYDDLDTDNDVETIALFGVDSPTGHHFLRLALDAGYRVRALVAPGDKRAGEFEDLHAVAGTYDDSAKVQEVVYSSTYVVCLLGESLSQKSHYIQDSLPKFVEALYRIMKRQDDPIVKAFLFQATSLSSDGRGGTPVLSKLLRKMRSKQQTTYLQDTDKAIKFIYKQHHGEERVLFPYIVTRPSLVIRDGPPSKKLAASKSVSTICLD